MLELTPFNLQKKCEWNQFFDLFSLYLHEVCDEEEYQENITDLHDDKLNAQMVEQTLMEHNPYFVMRIIENGVCKGLVSYSYNEEQRRGFVNNFFVRREYRCSGLGSAVYKIVENHLFSLGAKYIELIPVVKAECFYIRNGFRFSRISSNGERVFSREI